MSKSLSRREEFLKFAHSYKDRELIEFMKELFDRFSNNEIDEEILDSLIQETMAEYGRRNHPHMKKTLH